MDESLNKEYLIYDLETEERLDKYLNNEFSDMSRNYLQGLIKKDCVLVNNKLAKASLLLKKGDEIEITFPEPVSDEIEAEDIPLDIYYEDSDVIVVNKPSGILTIASSSEKEKTLYHLVGSYLKERNKFAKVFIIHRLDKDTSGIVMFAKNDKVKKLYQDKWNDIVKYRGYVAILEGTLPKEKDIIKLNLDDSDEYKVRVSKSGKEAITEYKVIKTNNDLSLVDINLHTGRRNQIRVTFSYLKHPVLGDFKYGSKIKVKRLMLHAYKLSVINPFTKKEMVFETKTPKEFNNYLK